MKPEGQLQGQKWGVSSVLPVITSFYFMNQNYHFRDCSFEIREGGAGRFEGRVIKFLTSFLGGSKIYNTRFGGYKFSYIKLLEFNYLAKYSALQLIETAFISLFDG